METWKGYLILQCGNRLFLNSHYISIKLTNELSKLLGSWVSKDEQIIKKTDIILKFGKFVIVNR